MVGRLDLQDVFKEQAEWRREKARQYPNEEHTSKLPPTLIGWPRRSMQFRKTGAANYARRRRSDPQ